MNSPAGWDDVRRIADELELQVHLGSMEARERWSTLEQRLVQVEKTIAHPGELAREAISHELVEIRDALLELREELVTRAHGDFASGW